MKDGVRVGLFMILGLLLVPGASFAHHSATVYETKQVITLTGTVTQFLWNNPHATIVLDAKDADGNIKNWVVELQPPSRLRRTGWNSATVKAGDQITVTGNPRKDGNARMNLQKIQKANGEPLNLGGADY